MQFQHEQAQHLLSKFHDAGIKSAVLAGGIVRDTIFGKDPKDIDIFVSQEDFDENKVKIALFEHEVSECDFSGYAEIPDVQRVFNISRKYASITEMVKLHCDLPAQIIVMQPGMSPLKRIETFDFGFCQVAYDGEKILFTDHFSKDYLDKTISLVYCENQHEWERSMIRFARISQKYPEFRLVCRPKHSYPDITLEPLEIPDFIKELFQDLEANQ